MFVANASPLSAFLLHRESWCSVRLRYQFNEHVQADFKQCLQYLSFSLHPFSYPYELVRKCTIHYTAHFRPLWTEPQAAARLFKGDCIVWLFFLFLYTCCNCGTFLHPVNTLFLYGKNGLDFGLHLNVLLAGQTVYFFYFFCQGFPGRRGEVGDPSFVRCRRHGGFEDPRQAEHSYLRLSVPQLLQRTPPQWEHGWFKYP